MRTLRSVLSQGQFVANPEVQNLHVAASSKKHPMGSQIVRDLEHKRQGSLLIKPSKANPSLRADDATAVFGFNRHRFTGIAFRVGHLHWNLL